MSVANQDGEKLVLGRTSEVPSVWTEYASENPQRWKGLACLTLSLQGWPLERIGLVIGHSKGHVSRLVADTRVALEKMYRQDSEAEELRGLAAAA